MKEQIFKLGEHLFTPCASIGAEWNDPDDAKRTKARTKQYTTLFLRTYESLESFVDALRALATLDAFSYIVHDKDVNDDGTTKESHIHALLHFPPDGRIRLTTLAKLFRHNTRVEIPLDVASCLDYMLHANQPDKYQYEPDERIDHNLDLLLGTRKSSEARQQAEKEAKNLAFLNDLDVLTPYQMAQRYGRDYIKNVDRYTTFRNNYIWTDVADPDADKRDAITLRGMVERISECSFYHNMQGFKLPCSPQAVARYLAAKLMKCDECPDLHQLVNFYCEALKMVAPASLDPDDFTPVADFTEGEYNPYA